MCSHLWATIHILNLVITTSSQTAASTSHEKCEIHSTSTVATTWLVTSQLWKSWLFLDSAQLVTSHQSEAMTLGQLESILACTIFFWIFILCVDNPAQRVMYVNYIWHSNVYGYDKGSILQPVGQALTFSFLVRTGGTLLRLYNCLIRSK